MSYPIDWHERRRRASGQLSVCNFREVTRVAEEILAGIKIDEGARQETVDRLCVGLLRAQAAAAEVAAARNQGAFHEQPSDPLFRTGDPALTEVQPCSADKEVRCPANSPIEVAQAALPVEKVATASARPASLRRYAELHPTKYAERVLAEREDLPDQTKEKYPPPHGYSRRLSAYIRSGSTPSITRSI